MHAKHKIIFQYLRYFLYKKIIRGEREGDVGRNKEKDRDKEKDEIGVDILTDNDDDNNDDENPRIRPYDYYLPRKP